MSTAAPVTDVQLLLPAQAELGEGALWDDQRQCLYWVDIEGRALHIFDPATGLDRAWPVPTHVGTVVPTTVPGTVIVALQSGIHRLDTATGALTLLANPITAPDLRFNDGKCDPAGRFWAGTMALDARPGAAALYRLDADLSLHEVLAPVSISNGLVWTADRRTMYYIDTPTLTVQAFDYDDATGRISRGRPVVRFPAGQGSPDGMTIDRQDNLWIALWGGARIECYNPRTAELLHTVRVPAPLTASCAFGGPNLQTLYITTARQGLSQAELRQYPHSGDLFWARPGATGVPAGRFRQAAAGG